MIGENTRILVDGEGYKKISSLSSSVSVWNGTAMEAMDFSVKENQEALQVKLINGIELLVNPEQYFSAVRKKGLVLASDLDDTCLACLNVTTPDFDYLDLSPTNYLDRIGSYDLGVLIGLIYYLSADSRVLDIPKVRKEAWKALEYIFKMLEIKYDKEEYYKRANRIRYEIKDEEFLKQLQPFLVKKEIPESFWSSKPLWKGFLKSVFTFSIIATKMFTIRAGKDTTILKDIQQALLFFGVNSTYSGGLTAGHLMIFKNNCYNLAVRIGAFNAERFFEGVDFKRFLQYSGFNTLDTLYSRVYNVKRVDSEVLYTLSGRHFMANGVMLENYE